MKTTLRNIIKITISLYILLPMAAASGSDFHPFMSNKSRIENQLPLKRELIVAYYGRPGTSKLGILGRYPLSTIMKKVKKRAKEYLKLNADLNVVPALELVHSMATTDPGAYKNYITPLSAKRTVRYIEAAQKEGLLVFLDHQLGKKSSLQAIKSLLVYLKYPNVHLAVDPEFAIRGRGVRPGKLIGHITGEDVNRMQAVMDSYMKENNITEEKILLVHMFKKGMLKRKNRIRYYPNIKVVMHLDGHGSSAVKINIYNRVYSSAIESHFAGGFKLFFNRDRPRLMTPSQVMGISSTQGRRIKNPPQFISYQ